jgi:hypothetical protein
MTGTDKDKRLSDAADLHRQIESLCNVKAAERQVFVHDRLMSAIDDICKKPDTGRVPFSPEQVRILKEISFRIVYIMDPLNKPQRGFLGALKREFSEKSAIEKVGIVVATLTFIVTSTYGVFTTGKEIYANWSQTHAAVAQPTEEPPAHGDKKPAPIPMIHQMPTLR